MVRGRLLQKELPVLRVDPDADVPGEEAAAALGPDALLRNRLRPGAHAVGQELVPVQIGVEDGLVVDAEPLDDLQAAQVLLVDEGALLVVLLDEGLELLLVPALLLDEGGPLVLPALPLLRGVPQEDIEDAAGGGALDEVTVVLNPPDGAVLAHDPVFHVIQIVLAGGDLLPDALLHLLQVLGVDHAPEGVPRQLPELRHILALKDPQQPAVGVDNPLPLLRAVDEEPAGHLVHELNQIAGRPEGGPVRQGVLLRHPLLNKPAELQRAVLEELHQCQNVFNQMAVPALSVHRGISLSFSLHKKFTT